MSSNLTPVSRRGLLVILSSPSGAGKSTMSRRLLAWDDSLSFSVSATTRAPRSGEVDGKDYYFKSRDAFMGMVNSGKMLEHAEVFDNHYGSPLEPVEAAIKNGRDVLFDIDWQGGQQISISVLKEAVVSIFILPPSMAELEKRLTNRGQDSEKVVADRMAKSRGEISHWGEYDYVLINDDVDICFDKIKTILKSERLRRNRQPGLGEYVNGLNQEFEALQK